MTPTEPGPNGFLPRSLVESDAPSPGLDLYLRLGIWVRHAVDCWALDLTAGS